MQSTSVTQRQPTIPAFLATVPAPVRKVASRPLQLQQLHKGQQLFTESALGEQSYLMSSGELLILRDGRPVDLVEAGDLLERALWPGATAIALTACTFEPLEPSSPRGQPR